MRIHIGTLLLIFVQALAGEDSQFRVHVVDPLHAGVNAARVDLIGRALRCEVW
jgi:hypothetical protein